RFRITNEKTKKWNGGAIDGCKEILNCVTNQVKANFQFGKTKIFIKNPELVFALEELRLEKNVSLISFFRERALFDYATTIQKYYKNYKNRKFYIEIKKKAMDIFSNKKKRRK